MSANHPAITPHVMPIVELEVSFIHAIIITKFEICKKIYMYCVISLKVALFKASLHIIMIGPINLHK